MKIRTYIKAFEMKIVPKGNLYHSVLTLEIRSVKSVTSFPIPWKKKQKNKNQRSQK